MIKVFFDCKNEPIFGKIAWNCSKIVFCQFIRHTLVFSNTFVFHIGEHFDESKLMISGQFSSFSSFTSILLLVEKVVSLFCALSSFIMSLPVRTTNETSLRAMFIWDQICSDQFRIGFSLVRIRSVYTGLVRNWNGVVLHRITFINEPIGTR